MPGSQPGPLRLRTPLADGSLRRHDHMEGSKSALDAWAETTQKVRIARGNPAGSIHRQTARGAVCLLILLLFLREMPLLGA